MWVCSEVERRNVTAEGRRKGSVILRKPEWLCQVFCAHIMDSCSVLVANSYLSQGMWLSNF